MKPKIVAISAILIAVLVAIPLVGAQGETSYSFTLTCPNVTKFAGCPPSPKQFCPKVANTDIHEGDRLSLEGAGTFDTSTGAVSGGGTFTHFNSDGTVHDTGNWTVTKFVNFNGILLEVFLNATTTEGKPLAPPPRFIFMGQISTAPEGVTIWYYSGGLGASSADSPLYPIFGLVESGCVTIEPAKPATQDLLAAYSIPIVIAIMVIAALLLLVLRTRKKKKT